RGGNTIAATTTDAFGRYVIHNVLAGSYSVEGGYLGYRSDTECVSIGVADALARADFDLVALPLHLSAVDVAAAVLLAVDYQTGGWDAEYSNQNAAVVHVTTRTPSGGFQLDASGYGGSVSANGQALNVSTNAGKVGLFFSGARQGTDMRREPVAFDSLHNTTENFHNDGTDLFGFGKIQYVPSDRDVVNLDVDRSRTRFAVPFDSVEGIIDDHQQDVNGFVNLGWRHRFAESSSGSGRSAELFTGAFFRDGSLNYTPGLTDDPTFVFAPDTTHYILSEDRNFHTAGLKLDYTLAPHHGLEL